jgi:5-methylcytosine-specific restriction endonuclease McrA
VAKATCSSCGKEVFRGPDSRAEIICLGCRRKKPIHDRISPSRIRLCAYPPCGKQFVATADKADGRKQQACSRSCGQKVRNGVTSEEMRRAANTARKRRKRHRKRGATAEPYTLEEIALRDHYRCGLCHRRVNMMLPYQHPKSATIDHLVPLDAGGDDTKANVQLAHRGCNARKCNRGGGEQLMLIG